MSLFCSPVLSAHQMPSLPMVPEHSSNWMPLLPFFSLQIWGLGTIQVEKPQDKE